MWQIRFRRATAVPVQCTHRCLPSGGAGPMYGTTTCRSHEQSAHDQEGLFVVARLQLVPAIIFHDTCNISSAVFGAKEVAHLALADVTIWDVNDQPAFQDCDFAVQVADGSGHNCALP